MRTRSIPSAKAVAALIGLTASLYSHDGGSAEGAFERARGGYQMLGEGVPERGAPEDARALADVLPPDSAAAPEILALVNGHRAIGAACGGTHFPPAPPLLLDGALNDAAALHALDMAQFDYISHVGRDGSSYADRIRDAGFSGRTVEENIAAGYATAAEVVNIWMSRTKSCTHIMNPAFEFMGAGHATVEESTYGTYWVQTFGAN